MFDFFDGKSGIYKGTQHHLSHEINRNKILLKI